MDSIINCFYVCLSQNAHVDTYMVLHVYVEKSPLEAIYDGSYLWFQIFFTERVDMA